MVNYEIRQALKTKRLYYYELADKLGISEYTLSKKLRKELSEDEKRRILEIIEKVGV